ncbi:MULTISPECIES: methyltransferase, TIGR04325 family [Chelativorans]|uniref:Methyltransferase, TIGR04325 family n=1 Tax=Chelativorans sp. (strain BNC1) TaxID=266779 RepID=Q11F55_CHESB|nr:MULTISPECIES: methyltransferase, TIGR04325 family [Chelativorans]
MIRSNVLARPRTFSKIAVATLRSTLLPLRLVRGRLRYLAPVPRRFSGAYASYAQALAAAQRSGIAGYDHEDVADVAFERMCEVAPWDYPVLFWMQRLSGEISSLVDAGGHMGTKYRAFQNLLPIAPELRWTVYDLPAIVRAGRQRAERDGLENLRFVDQVENSGAVDLFLGSGLLQYLDVSFPDLLGRLPQLPRHVILNKVALRRGRTVVTLEKIGRALVPYQIRNEASFLAEIEALGYALVDRWKIPSLSHVIETHPELGASSSEGFYFRL